MNYFDFEFTASAVGTVSVRANNLEEATNIAEGSLNIFLEPEIQYKSTSKKSKGIYRCKVDKMTMLNFSHKDKKNGATDK